MREFATNGTPVRSLLNAVNVNESLAVLATTRKEGCRFHLSAHRASIVYLPILEDIIDEGVPLIEFIIFISIAIL